MTPRRAAATSVVAVVGGVGLLLLVALWAASIGPDRVLHGPGLERNSAVASPASESASGDPPTNQAQPPPERAASPADHPFLRTLAYAVELAILLFVLWVLWRLGRRAWEAWRDRVRSAPRPEHVDFDVLDQPEEAREQLAAEADDALRVLAEGEPRNAIVAVWDLFEQAAGRLLLQRRPWETSSEFVIRMLDVVAADDRAVVELERIYREARFSSHPLGEEERRAARAALQRIQDSLVRARSRS